LGKTTAQLLASPFVVVLGFVCELLEFVYALPGGLR
jgi:hypothetical protein